MAHSHKKSATRVKSLGKKCSECVNRKLTIEHSAMKELEFTTELIAGLRAEKRSLKETLQSALARCEELNEKLSGINHTLHTEVKRRKAAEEELKTSRSENASLDRRLSECKLLLESRDSELQRLERMADKGSRETHSSSLESFNRSLKTEIGDLRQEQEANSKFVAEVRSQIEMFSSFILSKMHDIPEYNKIFKDRFRSYDELKAPDENVSLLKVLQFLKDLLIFEAQNRLKPKKKEQIIQAYEPEDFSAVHNRSFDKSMQTQAEKATNTVEAEVKVKNFSMISPIKPKPRPISIEKDNSFSRSLYKPPFSSPKTLKSPHAHKEASFDAGLSDTSGLIDALSMQNDKLSKLNQQIAETMASSRNLLNTSITLDSSRYPGRSSHYPPDPFEMDEPEISSSRKMNKVLSERDLAIPTQLDLKVIAEALQGSISSPRAPFKERSSEAKHFSFQSPTNRSRRAYNTEQELPGVTEFLKSPKESEHKFKSVAALRK
mmetsp:Transcript_27255/g.48968  ORF Transcript_27255/g.48968 Transcript_27255/m.48968 type:complete len:492 (+) Transcript_27255:204-1679(+)|eukprot:CAMPEP_0204897454 /NCGR_PEP_ID=MMETSP1397-20131031/754_1 /ASSEMBLY_ACC=CAM_ASM_000891 /TAXON_ID=49980 /ORGANISM="Climacostomum Climacostomum virens, Strain Stock W-24" /LENGTH=491 /DNA_ID=CAMNT_0052065213 /DNA_START=220 /DNA_END=1695 /DNA_ORIENTATION=+